MAKHKLQFTILDSFYQKPDLLVFSDDSSYMEPPLNPTIHVKFPGFEDWNTSSINSKNINRISTFKLGFEAEEFPDGVYEIKYSIEPHNRLFVSQYYVRTVKLQEQFKNYLKEIGSCEGKTIDMLWDIELSLQGAKIEAEQGNLNQALLMYQQAKKLLDRLTNC